MDMPAPRRRFDAVVFDLDGTLIDSAPDIHEAINDVLAKDGLPPLPLPIVTSFIGNGVARLVERAYRHAGMPLAREHFALTVARFSEAYTDDAAVLTRPFPGVAGGLEVLDEAGMRLGVCTNKPHAITERILDALDLAPFFDAVIGGDSCAVKKPDAEPLLACLRRLDVAPDRAIYVGDSETDVKTARAAGVPSLVVTYGYTTVPAGDLGADETIDRIDRWAEAMLTA